MLPAINDLQLRITYNPGHNFYGKNAVFWLFLELAKTTKVENVSAALFTKSALWNNALYDPKRSEKSENLAVLTSSGIV